jgi:hypothetical protein
VEFPEQRIGRNELVLAKLIAFPDDVLAFIRKSLDTFFGRLGNVEERSLITVALARCPVS